MLGPPEASRDPQGATESAESDPIREHVSHEQQEEGVAQDLEGDISAIVAEVHALSEDEVNAQLFQRGVQLNRDGSLQEKRGHLIGLRVGERATAQALMGGHGAPRTATHSFSSSTSVPSSTSSATVTSHEGPHYGDGFVHTWVPTGMLESPPRPLFPPR